MNEGDEVVEVLLTSGKDEILIANHNGRAIRFNESTVRNMGRGATGVKAMRLDDDEEDEVVGMIALTKPEGYDENAEENGTDEELYPDMPTILVLSEKGVGKRSTIGEYRITNRNGKGVKTINITEKTGKLVAIKKVMEDEDIMIINKSGVTIRLAVSDIKKSSRNTQGVKLIDIQKRNDVISSVCVVEHSEEPEDINEEDVTTPETNNTEE